MSDVEVDVFDHKHRSDKHKSKKHKKRKYVEKNANTEKANEPDVNVLLGLTGGAYIPPAKLKAMKEKITDKKSEAYQRIAWEALKKSIHGLINKVNVSNITEIVKQILSENIVRGRGLFAKSILLAQSSSPTFTHVFAALISIINTRLPQVGELVVMRLINDFRKSFRRNQKDRCLTDANFLAHLVNQRVVHELIILELLTLLLEQTTNDSVEVAIMVLKECGLYLQSVVPQGLHGIFEHLRRILNDGQCDKRVGYMIEVLFQIRRESWKDYPTIIEELDLVEEDDIIVHSLSLLDEIDPEEHLNVFKFDENYEENEKKYESIKANFLSADTDDDEDDDDDDDDEDDDEENGNEDGTTAKGPTKDGQTIIDQTETNLITLRRTIYLMMQSSLSSDEGAHRLLQLKIRPGEEYEVASMVLDCCAQTRSYERRYGQLAQRLCSVKVYQNNDTQKKNETPSSAYGKPSGVKERLEEKKQFTGPCISYQEQFERIFVEQYTVIHRLETSKLRNIAMFFSHLLFSDSINWTVLQCIKLNERDTTASGRIFIKHMLLDMNAQMGLAKLQERLRDETIQPHLTGIFPRNNPKDTRFAINFLTVIGLGGLSVDLREFLNQVKEGKITLPPEPEEKKDTSDDSSSSDSSSDDDSSSSSSSSNSSSSSSSSSSSDSSSSSNSSSSSSDSSSSSSSSDSDSPKKKKKKKPLNKKKNEKKEKSPHKVLREVDEKKKDRSKHKVDPKSKKVKEETPNRQERKSRREPHDDYERQRKKGRRDASNDARGGEKRRHKEREPHEDMSRSGRRNREIDVR